MDATLVLREARLVTMPDLVDVAIADQKILAIAPKLPAMNCPALELDGRLVTSPFVESHIHLDSALTVGEPRWNESGTLFEGIDIWRERKAALTLKDVKARAIQALRMQAEHGVLFVRSHADVSEHSLTALKALLDVRAAVKDWMTLQVVAFPQDGFYGHERNAELVEEALRLGADAVGGIPHYELTREDGVRSLHKIFELAQKYDRLIDVHCDEIDDPQSRFLEVMAANCIRSGLSTEVTASHTTAFGSYDDAYAFKLMGTLRRANLNVIANPLINITLQGRTDSYPKRRGVTRVKELWQNGLNVSLGHDCIQDPWYGLGTGNVLAVVEMAVHVCQMTGRAEMDACFDMVTTGGAKTLNLGDGYGLAVGRPANLVVLDARSRYEAILQRSTVRYVISKGKVLVETVPSVVKWH